MKGGVVLFMMFLPFFVSLLGTSIFKLMAFISNCATVFGIMLLIGSAAASGPPNPKDIYYEILVYGSWSAAWAFAEVGIWRNRHQKRLSQPAQSEGKSPIAFHGHLRGKDAAYLNNEQE